MCVPIIIVTNNLLINTTILIIYLIFVVNYINFSYTPIVLHSSLKYEATNFYIYLTLLQILKSDIQQINKKCKLFYDNPSVLIKKILPTFLIYNFQKTCISTHFTHIHILCNIYIYMIK